MKIMPVDFETYFAPDYSLSRKDTTTESYIRDPRFQIIMVGVRLPDGTNQWFSGTHEQTREFLGDLGYESMGVLHHHAHFDAAIANWVLGLKPKVIFDTLSMARPIHGAVEKLSLKRLCELYGLGTKGDDTTWAKGLRREQFTPEQLETYGGYCATREDSDVNLTWRLFEKLLPHYTANELLIIDNTVRMFSEPALALNRPLLEEHLHSVRENKRRLLEEAGVDKATLMSNPKFALLLESFGAEPPTKISPTTGKTTWAFAKTDQGMKDLLEHENEAVQAFAAARMGVKSTLEETRTERMIDIAKRGLFPVPLLYSGAVTTQRHSGTDKVNPQNMTRGSALRYAIEAMPGECLVAGDLSGIELRVCHTLAGQQDSIAAFREGRDLYCEFASQRHGRTITKADTAERFGGKVAELQLMYQSGWAKYQQSMRVLSKGTMVPTDAGLAARPVGHRAEPRGGLQARDPCDGRRAQGVRGCGGEGVDLP